MPTNARLTLIIAAALSLMAVTAALAEEEGAVTAGAALKATESAPGASAAGVQPSQLPLTPQQMAIREVQERAGLQVQELVAAMANLEDGPALRALQLKVDEIKKQSRVEVLRLKATFARERGDLAEAQEAERLIQLILNPPAPVLHTVERHPGELVEGGAR